MSKKYILLSTIYRPPDNDGDSVQNLIFHIESLLYGMYSKNIPTILMGDINIDLLSEKVDKTKNILDRNNYSYGAKSNY